MAVVQTLIGNVKGPQGERGAQGEQGEQGEAATIEVGTVTTVPYGQTASVVNSGTESEAVFDFTIPQGRPGEQVTDMQNLTLGAITTSAASFPIPAVGETGKVIFGKIVKWFSDMAALVASKFDAANVVNNLTTTFSGYALDARQGKTLNDAIDAWHPSAYTALASGSKNVTATFAYTGLTFTLQHRAAVYAMMSYNQASPKRLGIANSASTFNQNTAFAHGAGAEQGFIVINGILPPGTYYVWGAGYTAGENNIFVYGIRM